MGGEWFKCLRVAEKLHLQVGELELFLKQLEITLGLRKIKENT